MGGGNRLFARVQLLRAGWARSGQTMPSPGRKRERAVGIHSKRERQGPGMARGILPPPCSSVGSVVPGARTLVPSVTWKPLFLASFSLVCRGSRSLEVGGVGCGRG